MEIINNVLNNTSYKYLLNTIDNSNFSWHYKKNVHYPKIISNDIKSHGFLHLLFWDNKIQSQYFDITLNILFTICDKLNLNFESIIRAHAALSLNIGGQHDGFPHTDIDESSDIWKNPNWKTVIYYLNTSDGDTVFYDNGNIFFRSPPEKNKAIIFDGKIQHSAMLPVNNPYRITLNFNFLYD
jgi:hypothetical protein